MLKHQTNTLSLPTTAGLLCYPGASGVIKDQKKTTLSSFVAGQDLGQSFFHKHFLPQTPPCATCTFRPSESLSTFASWPSLLFWGVQCRMGSKQASTSATKTMSTSTTQGSTSFQNHREHHQDRKLILPFRCLDLNVHNTIHRANAFKEPAILKPVELEIPLVRSVDSS